MSRYSVSDLGRMFAWNIIDEAFLDRAVEAGWITQEEKDSIVQEG
ncbi:hypothetical protein SANA_22770 [Gottschalkiaceae bacterium SANA]|nr:hypothetical protein SANA_22770 [Gottschalkiaceae bacterium SANA]